MSVPPSSEPHPWDPDGFRAQFPVFRERAYLNAGTAGPVPQAAARAAAERIELELRSGRAGPRYFEATVELAGQLRSAYAAVLGCQADEVALTGSTTDGVNTVLAGLDLQPGDEILTSDEEHPGLLAPLGRLRRYRAVQVRVVPFGELAQEVSRSTRLVACSHVSWVGGRVMDIAALRATEVPVLLDGAQALGAIPVDVQTLGCDFYAASGQKWLCGPEGSGCLYVRAERLPELAIPWPGYGSLEDPQQALELVPAPTAKRLDHGFPVGVRSAWALASLQQLQAAGWSEVHGRALKLAHQLTEDLAGRGLDVAPRGASTLVSWRADDAEAEAARLQDLSLVVRSVPGRGLVRASVGAWSSEGELEQLVQAVAQR